MKKSIRIISLILAVLSLSAFFTFSTAAASAEPIAAAVSAEPLSTSQVEYNTGSFLVTKGKANVVESRYSLTDTYRLDGSSLVIRADSKTYTNLFGIRFYKVYVGKKTFFIRVNDLKQASSSYTTTVVQTQRSTALRFDANKSGSVKKTLEAGSVLPAAGVVYNCKEKTSYYQILLPDENKLCFVKVADCTTKVNSKGNVFLPLVKHVEQSTNFTCSSASAVTVLNYFRIKGITDKVLQNETQGVVGRITTALNKRLGSGRYSYVCTTAISRYESAIRGALAANKPVILRVAFGKNSYFAYTTSGHYLVCTGIFTKNGQTWLRLLDPFNTKRGGSATVNIPLKTLFNYALYQGKSSAWAIV